MSKYLFLSLLSFFLALFFTPLVRRAALGIGAIDRPNERKVHQRPIARLGGVAIAASFFLTLLAAVMADRLFGPFSYFDPTPWQGLFLGAGVVAILAPLLVLGLPLFDTLLTTMVLSSAPPLSVMIIDLLLFSSLATMTSISFRLLEYMKFKGEERDRRALIYGAGEAGGLKVEEPFTYRHNYGLALWKAGLDGTCNYAYQHAFNNIWDDFDHPTYRDHVMAYPTLDGVIPTIQWEGFREGVDDVRYLTTLQKVMEEAKGKEDLADTVNEARGWMNDLDPSQDLQDLRWKIVERIIKISPPESLPAWGGREDRIRGRR